MSIDTVVRLEREIARLQALQAEALVAVAARAFDRRDRLGVAIGSSGTSGFAVENCCGCCGFGNPDVRPLS